ncbi:MAG TPA: 23S rRNA (uracil(1939)-C(5))-methyltransferase RlmD [Woeseiaceae bacterium]|nr:23S rRNA (uracil(1939)-C(5))-methyltransferase RlmD [Woeseiaceae bacterium]
MSRPRRPEPEVATIAGVTHDGRGIVSGDGKKVFVAGALAGERVRYLRRKRRRNYDEAELLEVLDATPERVKARCAAYGRCGGCSLQHVGADAQRAIKFRTLADNLERIGRVTPARWLEPLAGDPWHYRRRARLAVKDVPAKGRVLVGFRERHAPLVTDMARCEVLARPVDGLIGALSDLLAGVALRARVPQIEVAVADNAVALVFRVLDEPGQGDRAALARFAAQHDIQVWLQPGGLESLVPLAPADPAPLVYTLPAFDLTITFEPVDFVQVNAALNEAMVSLAVGLLAPVPGDRVLDLFCGIGNFTLPLARRAGEVLGLEGDASLVARAGANAAANGIGNARFRVADLSLVDGREDWFARPWDLVLLDPARNGAAEVAARMQKLGPRRVVYVSCHPGTLARDAGTLVHEQGYRLEAAGIVDMFPHTAHVESVAVFAKENS